MRWLGRIVGSALTIVLAVVLLPYASRLAARLLPDESGAAIKVSAVLSSKLENSARLETMKVHEEGVIHYDIQAAILGPVASIDVQYAYDASFGVDLSKVTMQVTGGTIIFLLPEPELLQDSLVPTQTYRDDFWYPGFSDADHQKLLEDERVKRQAAYLDGENAQALWDATINAFEETIAAWLADVDADLTFAYEKAPAQTETHPE